MESIVKEPRSLILEERKKIPGKGTFWFLLIMSLKIKNKRFPLTMSTAFFIVFGNICVSFVFNQSTNVRQEMSARRTRFCVERNSCASHGSGEIVRKRSTVPLSFLSALGRWRASQTQPAHRATEPKTSQFIRARFCCWCSLDRKLFQTSTRSKLNMGKWRKGEYTSRTNHLICGELEQVPNLQDVIINEDWNGVSATPLPVPSNENSWDQRQVKSIKCRIQCSVPEHQQLYQQKQIPRSLKAVAWRTRGDRSTTRSRSWDLWRR